MTQEQHRRGTAAVALRRLVHPGATAVLSVRKTSYPK
jgi:hypothetical protein